MKVCGGAQQESWRDQQGSESRDVKFPRVEAGRWEGGTRGRRRVEGS